MVLFGMRLFDVLWEKMINTFGRVLYGCGWNWAEIYRQTEVKQAVKMCMPTI